MTNDNRNDAATARPRDASATFARLVDDYEKTLATWADIPLWTTVSEAAATAHDNAQTALCEFALKHKDYITRALDAMLPAEPPAATAADAATPPATFAARTAFRLMPAPIAKFKPDANARHLEPGMIVTHDGKYFHKVVEAHQTLQSGNRWTVTMDDQFVSVDDRIPSFVVLALPDDADALAKYETPALPQPPGAATAPKLTAKDRAMLVHIKHWEDDPTASVTFWQLTGADARRARKLHGKGLIIELAAKGGRVGLRLTAAGRRALEAGAK